LVAQSYARPRLRAGDEVLVTGLEHHSNIVPWQLVCGQTGARLVVAPITERGDVALSAVQEKLGARTRIVAVAHASNALGTVLPVREICAAAHAVGATAVIDGAQAVPHLPVDVTNLGCDFYAFSGHKVYGPTGVGVLYGRGELLAAMDPYQGGGDMIESVTFEATRFKPPPHRFEAGTPNIAGVIGLAAALDYVQGLGWAAMRHHESALLDSATDRLRTVPGVEIVGRSDDKIGVLSFVVEGVHPHDLATIADLEGVAIRAGHHCAQPLMDRLGIVATARASFAAYNSAAEVEALHRAVLRAKELLS
jgi:cysteine desulfurase/selenocysteine lyase